MTGSRSEALRIIRSECGLAPLVLKPLFGAQGWGLKLIRREEDLPTTEEARGVFYLQRFVPPRDVWYEDMRILVSHGEIIGAMRRRSRRLDHQYPPGREATPCEPSARERELALRAAARSARISPASTSSAAPTACPWCWRSTACQAGAGCRA